MEPFDEPAPPSEETGTTAGRRAWPALVIRSGECTCAIALEHVREIMRPLPTRPLAGAAPFVTGVAVVRGVAVPVVHLGSLLERDNDAPPGRFVSLRVGERGLALAVDSVVGLRHLDPSGLEATPPLLRALAREVVAMVSTLDRQLLLVLRAARLLPEDLPPALPADSPEVPRAAAAEAAEAGRHGAPAAAGRR